MPTVKQVLEKFSENPEEVIGQLLVAIDKLHNRVQLIESFIYSDHPDNWDKEETHLS